MLMMGKLTYFVSLQIKQLKDKIFIFQSKYISELLKKSDMNQAQPYGTPMGHSMKLDLDEGSKKVEVTLFRGIISSLLYLTTSKRDIMFSVCMCAHFQSNPKESHLIAIKRILRYLKGTSNIGLWYPKLDCCYLYGYTDADYASSITDRNSSSGAYHFLGHCLVSWHSKKTK